MDIQFKTEEAEKDRQKDILVAEIRASGYGAMMDINKNQESDFKESMKDIRQTEQYRDQMNFKREQEVNKNAMGSKKMDLEREKLQTQKDIADKQLQIARENKNKYDKPGKKSK